MNANEFRRHVNEKIERTKTDPVCDFCSTPSIAAIYDCGDLNFGRVEDDTDQFDLVSKGEWMACAKCEKIIDLRDWGQLAHRAVDSLMPKESSSSEDRMRVGYMLFMNYHVFGRSMTGKRTK